MIRLSNYKVIICQLRQVIRHHQPLIRIVQSNRFNSAFLPASTDRLVFNGQPIRTKRLIPCQRVDDQLPSNSQSDGIRVSKYFKNETLKQTHNQTNRMESCKLGSFIEYLPIYRKQPKIGIIIKQPEPINLSTQIFTVLTSKGKIELVNQSDITFNLVDFIDPTTILEKTKLSTNDKIDLQIVLIKFSNYCKHLSDEISNSRSLDIVHLYISNERNQSSIKLNHFASHFTRFESDQPFFDHDSLKIPAIALLYSLHLLILSCPAKYRYLHLTNNQSIDIFDPVDQIDTPYFINPLSLTKTIDDILKLRGRELGSRYYNLLNAGSQYEYFTEKEKNEEFRKLVDFIRYTIEYPHPKLTHKLRKIFPDMKKTPRNLYDKLAQLEIKKANNSVLSSGIFGFTLKDRGESHAIYPISQQLNSLIKKRSITQYIEYVKRSTRQKPELSQESIHEESPVYQITRFLGFSIKQVSFYEIRFSFYIPIPFKKFDRQSINNPSDMIFDIDESRRYHLFKSPFFKIFDYELSGNQSCFKLSFQFDIDALLISLKDTKPDLSVVQLRKTTLLDEKDLSMEFNQSWIAFSLDLEKALKTDSIHMLYILLKAKENERLSNGFLRPNSNNKYDEDYNWFVNNINSLVNELLTKYCKSMKIPIVTRTQNLKTPAESKDCRVFYKFKIFKTVCNSYMGFLTNCLNREGHVSLTNMISCSKYLNPPELKISKWEQNEEDDKADDCFIPHGLKGLPFASFTNPDTLESYINSTQLLRGVVPDKYFGKHNGRLSLDSILVKLDNNQNSLSSLKLRLRRYKLQKRLYDEMQLEITDKNDDELMNRVFDFNFFKCIVVEPPCSLGVFGFGICKSYCVDFDLIVDVVVNTLDGNGNRISLMVGDRIICTEILEVDPVEDQLVLR